LSCLERIADEVLHEDILIVGSEGAGARAALEASRHGLKVLVATKGIIGKSGATLTADADVDVDSRSCIELFGLPGDPNDSPEKFAEDMIREAEFINDQELVKIHCEEAPARIKEVVDWGARIDKLTQAPGHRYPRGIWIPGTEFPKALVKEIKKRDNIKVIDNFMVTDILLTNGRVAGAVGINLNTGQFYVIKAKAVVLCTGGAMRIYPRTTAPEELTGDGMAMAYRAGAELVDMEFPMFLPYTLIKPDSLTGVDFTYNLSAYVECHALNRLGQRYMKDWDPVRLEMSTRDINSIATMMQVLEGKGSPNNGTYLSLTHLPRNILEYTAEWLPKSLSNWRYGGFKMTDFLPDVTQDAIETSPASHFWNGGIKINERCETNVPGLFAAGEGTGSIMGANRVSGNALTMTQVWGHRAGIFAAQYSKETDEATIDLQQVAEMKEQLFGPLTKDKGADAVETRIKLQELAWMKVGVVRDGKGLEDALEQLEEVAKEVQPELAVKTKAIVHNREWIEAIQIRNIVQIMELVAKASLTRKESRGALYRRDYPKTDNVYWLKNIIVSKEGDETKIRVQDVELKYFQPKRVVREYGLKG
jgi:succinate dehydrogenase/fumarate reductase flavoprotein subunit